MVRTLLCVVALWAALVGLGCATPESGGEAESSPLDGFDRELASLVPQLLDAYAVPGAAIGVIHNGEVWQAVTFGFADVEAERPVTTETAFNVGSISKTVAAWGVMRLVEQGQLDLDAPAGRYLTRWQLPSSEFDHDGVTVRRLLSHTAGLSLSGYPGFEPAQLLPSVEESLVGATNGAGDVRVVHEPGSRWQYSGGGYTMAQLILEEVTGRSFSDYMQAEVLQPLGMTSSSYVWDQHVAQMAATPYGMTGEPIPGPRFTATAAAGLQTTLSDFMRFALGNVLALDGDQGTAGVISRETLATMQTLVATSDEQRVGQPGGSGYGLGYDLFEAGGVKFAGHGGANAGWMARLITAPETGDAVVVMTNGSNGGRVHRAITCAWQTRVSATPCDDPPQIPIRLPEETLRRYEGRYEVPDGTVVPAGSVLEMRLENGRLVSHYLDEPPRLMVARSEVEFFLGGLRVAFETEDAGTATALLIARPGSSSVVAPRID